MDSRPNIVMIMTDQQRFDSLGCYGAHWVQTPHLDRLAAEGVLFEHCYVNNPVCTPSRASIWTGKELPGHGVYKLHDVLPEDELHFSELLRREGYRTGLFGKLHTSGRIYEAEKRHPTDGFHEYEWCLEASIHLDSPHNGYAAWLKRHHPDFYERLSKEGRKVLHHPREVHFTHWAAERSIDFIRRSVPEQPFFCCMSLFDPHNPYEDYPAEMAARVDQASMPAPLRDRRPAAELPAPVHRERHHSYLGDFDSFTDDDVHRMRLGYYASVALIDLEVGRVLDALAEQGLENNTLVIFVSDHGDMIGDHDLTVKGAFFYDAATRVPLIMRWPARYPAGRRVGALVQPHDLAATVLGAAGIPHDRGTAVGRADATAGATTEAHSAPPHAAPDAAPGTMTARDLTPLASGERDEHRDFVVCCYRNSGICDTGRSWEPPVHGTMIRTERYKLNLYHADPAYPGADAGRHAGGEGSPERPVGELYDMQEDPQELGNLWNDRIHAAAKGEIMGKLANWFLAHELTLRGSRGGDVTPDPAQQLVNKLK